MPTKEHIVDEIRRVAGKNGHPPGRQVFERETGIRVSDWHGVYWRCWGDALKEAGYKPNKKQHKFSSDELLRQYAEVVRHYGRVPAEIDIRMYSREHDDFPGHTTFANHFGNKAGLISALRKRVSERGDFVDLLDLLPEPGQGENVPASVSEGFVYLLKSGKYYKVGRSDELERRVKQINVALPEKVTLEHAIRTDDPPGIEAYWHRRFAEQRANGEWFRFSVADIRAFKRRRFQ
ncbi:MAG: GIY-YIG nuclease family protein [Proteobacteria bacterium]|nr:GIY-YIG nuclease family protein [Pseudomonadota bacterium]